MAVERCEYDPETGDAAEEGAGCDRPAVVVVGAMGQWHLCEQCAALPAFRRYRSRVLRGMRGEADGGS